MENGYIIALSSVAILMSFVTVTLYIKSKDSLEVLSRTKKVLDFKIKELEEKLDTYIYKTRNQNEHLSHLEKKLLDNIEMMEEADVYSRRNSFVKEDGVTRHEIKHLNSAITSVGERYEKLTVRVDALLDHLNLETRKLPERTVVVPKEKEE